MTIEQDKTEIRSLIYRLAGSYGAKDVDGLMDSYVRNGAVVVGTGKDEVRLGWEEIKEQVAREVSEPDTLSVSFEGLSIEVFGDAAFAFTHATISATFDGKHIPFLLRLTFGLTRTDEGWRVAQSHASEAEQGLPEGRAFPVELTDTLSNLLTSVDAEEPSQTTKDLGTATFLFTDIVDSTALSQSMGDRRWSEVIADHFRVVADIVESEGGKVVKTLGDGGMYVFASGSAALIAAIRTQRAVTTSDDERLRLRVGVHTGDVVRGQDDYIGLTVSKAARVAAAAEGDQILVSSTTAQVVNHAEIDLGDPITVELKGLAGTHVLLPLDWAG